MEEARREGGSTLGEWYRNLDPFLKRILDNDLNEGEKSQIAAHREAEALVARHLAWADFEIEAKAKNRASMQIARHIQALEQAAPIAAE